LVRFHVEGNESYALTTEAPQEPPKIPQNSL
jgi:hypothetical protein